MTARRNKVRLSPTQRKILENVKAGRSAFHGRPAGMSAAGGWDCSLMSLYRRGLLRPPGLMTAAGEEVLAQ